MAECIKIIFVAHGPTSGRACPCTGVIWPVPTSVATFPSVASQPRLCAVVLVDKSTPLVKPSLLFVLPLLVVWCAPQINKLHLCKPLIRAIDSSNLKDDYSTAQRVTYKYYVGRKAMFDSDFKQGVLSVCILEESGSVWDSGMQ